MKLLLSIFLALVGLAMGQKYRYWSDASCLQRDGYREIFPEAQEVACDALESLQTITDIGSIPDSDMRRVFEMVFNTHIDDPTLYGASHNWQRRFQRNSYKTAYQHVEDTLNALCHEWGELEQGKHKKEAEMLIYCDGNANAVEYVDTFYDMDNGIMGSSHCQNPRSEGIMQAHLWNHPLGGDSWAGWNPNRVRMTLCEHILDPIIPYKSGEFYVRDLSQWELGGQSDRSPSINFWTLHMTTGTFIHEWTHAHPVFTDDVSVRDPITNAIVQNSAYGWENCIQKPAGIAVINADNYLMFMAAAWLGRQKRYITQHHEFLGGYTLPRDDDVSTDEDVKRRDIAQGILRFYTNISTPGNPHARWA